MLLPTTRCLASVAPGSSAGSASREQEAEGLGTKRGNLAEPLPSRRRPTAAAWCENDAASAECPATPRPGLDQARESGRDVSRPSASCSRLADPAELPGATLARHRVVGNNIQLAGAPRVR